MATHKPVEVEELYGDLTISDSDKRWFAVYTKPRREKKLAKYAYKNKINYYLPLKDSVKHYKYRKIKFTKPLFPGYLFTHVDKEGKKKLIRTGFIATFLKVIDEKRLVHNLKQIYQGHIKGADFKRHKYIEKGMKVEIKSGPFIGLEGYIESINKKNKLILKVDFLKQAVSIKVKENQVKILR